ncbi:MAG: hypothetical protein IJ363_06685 [Clostridia bacterium]|nr:hypothetical protein [Clostridia bacterium]
MKRILTLLLAVLMLAGSVMGLASCSASEPAPDIDQVYDRLVQVIEASHEVNVLLFGAGLPVYPRGDAEDELVHRYYGVADNGQQFVTPYAKYASIAEMQAAIAAVYSTEYRESLYESLFTGFAADEMSVVMPARFSEDERFLYMSKYVDPLVDGVRVYDYASMEIVSYSHSSRLRVSVNSYTEDRPEEWKRVYLSFVYENGDWYLDSPSC